MDMFRKIKPKLESSSDDVFCQKFIIYQQIFHETRKKIQVEMIAFH